MKSFKLLAHRDYVLLVLSGVMILVSFCLSSPCCL